MPSIVSVLPPNPKLQIRRNTGSEYLGPLPMQVGQIIRMNDVLPEPSGKIVRREPAVVAGFLIQMSEISLSVCNPHNLRNSVSHSLQLRLTCSQLLTNSTLLRNRLENDAIVSADQPVDESRREHNEQRAFAHRCLKSGRVLIAGDEQVQVGQQNPKQARAKVKDGNPERCRTVSVFSGWCHNSGRRICKDLPIARGTLPRRTPRQRNWIHTTG